MLTPVHFGAVYKAETPYRSFDAETKSSSSTTVYSAVLAVEREREGRGIPVVRLDARDLELPAHGRPALETMYLFTATDAAKARPLIAKIKRLGELIRCFDSSLYSENQFKEGAALTRFLKGENAAEFGIKANEEPLSLERSKQWKDMLVTLIREEHVETATTLKDMVAKAPVKTIDVEV